MLFLKRDNPDMFSPPPSSNKKITYDIIVGQTAEHAQIKISEIFII
jgi:hypothetical protein